MAHFTCGEAQRMTVPPELNIFSQTCNFFGMSKSRTDPIEIKQAGVVKLIQNNSFIS